MRRTVAYNLVADEHLRKPRHFRAKFWHPEIGKTMLFCKPCFTVLPVVEISGQHVVLSCGHKRRQQL
jgi:hypothetical protein